jgi:mRNA interferase MazF
MNFPKRGEIYWGPGKKKTRPLLVVSNNLGNQYSSDVVVIPGTTQNTDSVYPVEVLVRKGFLNLQNFRPIQFLPLKKMN